MKIKENKLHSEKIVRVYYLSFEKQTCQFYLLSKLTLGECNNALALLVQIYVTYVT